MSTRAELKTFISGLSTGISTIKTGSMPSNPNECIAILEYGGFTPDMVFGQSAIEIDHPRLQILFRGEPKDYDTPMSAATVAYRAMASAGAQTISGTRYLALTPIQPPFLLRKDENDRFEIAFNVAPDKNL